MGSCSLVSRHTAAGLPAKAVEVKASTWDSGRLALRARVLHTAAAPAAPQVQVQRLRLREKRAGAEGLGLGLGLGLGPKMRCGTYRTTWWISSFMAAWRVVVRLI
jgi:hypothetical protein